MQDVTSAKHVAEFLEQYDTILLDMDGVIWQGDTLLPRTIETLTFLNETHRLIFVTNNSTKSRTQYCEKFKRLGISFVNPSMVVGSSYALAMYLNEACPEFDKARKRAYVLGEEGIVEELESVGIRTVGGVGDRKGWTDKSEMENVELEEDVGVVVCGFDFFLNYKKLVKAHLHLSNPETLFVITNNDATFPVGGRPLPGTGSIIETLINSTGRRPRIVGKPHKSMMDSIIRHFHLEPERTCMIGDRLNTDIAFGKAGGLGTALVLTGVTSRDVASRSEGNHRPDFVLEALSVLLDKDAVSRRSQ